MKYVLCVFSPARKKFKTDILLRVEVPKSTSMMVTENFNEVALQLIFANLFCYQYLHIPKGQFLPYIFNYRRLANTFSGTTTQSFT